MVRRLWGDLAFDEAWSRTSQDGPLLSFKRLLQEQGLESSFLAAGPEWLKKHSAHTLLDEALSGATLHGSANGGRASEML